MARTRDLVIFVMTTTDKIDCFIITRVYGIINQVRNAGISVIWIFHLAIWYCRVQVIEVAL